MPRGIRLVTLEDAGKYITGFPKGRSTRRRTVGMAGRYGSLILVAT